MNDFKNLVRNFVYQLASRHVPVGELQDVCDDAREIDRAEEARDGWLASWAEAFVDRNFDSDGSYVVEHYKRLTRYRVLGTAQLATNGGGDGTIVVVYRDLATGMTYVRDRVEFEDRVDVDGTWVKRFKIVTS